MSGSGHNGVGVEAWYRALLQAYPRSYRQQHGEEIVEVLLAVAPNAMVPSVRESWSLLRRGTAARLALAGAQSWGVPAGAAGVTLALLMAVITLQGRLVDPVPGALFLLTCAAVVLGRARLAAAAAWVATVTHAAVLLPQVRSPGSWGPNYQLMIDLGGGAQMMYPSQAVHEAQLIGLWIAGLALAVLLTGRQRLAGGRAALGRRTLLTATGAGLAVAVLTEMVVGGPDLLAPAATALVLLTAMYRTGIILRCSLLLAASWSYLLLAGQADGSGSRLPGEGLPLALTLAVIPVLAATAAWVVLTVHESDTHPRTDRNP